MEKEGSSSATPESDRRAIWDKFSELGLLSLGFEDRYGGFPDCDVECMLVAEALGKGLNHSPFYSTVILCGTALRLSGTDELKARFIPAIIDGRLRMAFAYAEPNRHYGLTNISMRADVDAGGFLLSGTKCMVVDAPSADYFLVTAGINGSTEVSLLLVPAGATNLRRRDFITTDGRSASELVFHEVKIDQSLLLGRPHEGLSVVEEATDRTQAALCADAVGAMQHLFDTTLEYTKSRKQFGLTIASFQAIQHRLADLYVELELAKAMSLYANLQLRKPAKERQLAVSQAKVQVAQAARLVGRQAIQLHGGMGMTEECHVGHYFKRLIAFEAWLGDINYHARRIEHLQSGF